MKRFYLILVLIFILTFSSATVLAAETLPSFVFDKDTGSTKQTLITITRPTENEIVFDRYFMVCGVTERSDIKVLVMMLDDKSGKFEAVSQSNAKSIEVGMSGFFGQFVYLRPGTNVIRVYAYSKSQPEVYQITNHTVRVENEQRMVTLLNSATKMVDSKLTDTLKESITPFR